MSIATAAPLPGRRELWALIAGAAPDDATLAAPWIGDGDRPHFFSRAAFGLAAVVAAHRAPRLFLPDYFCNSATLPARERGARLVFYPIDEALSPDWAKVETLAAAAKPDLFLQVHYFGFPTDLAPARAFCDRHGAALIEDAAHAVMPGSGIGHTGDYVLWSLHKHLAIPDGGLLVARNGAPVATLPGPAPDAVAWLAKRLLQRGAPWLASRLRRTAPPFERDPDPASPGPPALSQAARRMIAASDPRRIADERIAGDLALRETIDLPPLLPMSDGSWAPYRAVFRGNARDYDRLAAAGLPVETWPDLAPEIRAAPGSHATAVALRNSLLTVPCQGDARALAHTARRARRRG